MQIPPQAMEDRKGLLHPSKLGHILDDMPMLRDYLAESGEFIKYKGRFYCWTAISQEGQIFLTKK